MSRFLRFDLRLTVLLSIALCAAASAQPVEDPSHALRVKPTIATEDCTGSGCHGALLTRKVMHGPVAAQKCLDCHQYADESQHRFKSLKAPNEGCTGCHDMKLKSVVHAPVQKGNCTSCHDPHGS